MVGPTIIGILFIWRESTGLFLFSSWEEVMSLVQMLFVRSQDGEALSWRATEEVHPNWITTMAWASLYPISWATMHHWWHFSQKYTKGNAVFLEPHAFHILWYFLFNLDWRMFRERWATARQLNNVIIVKNGWNNLEQSSFSFFNLLHLRPLLCFQTKWWLYRRFS